MLINTFSYAIYIYIYIRFNKNNSFLLELKCFNLITILKFKIIWNQNVCQTGIFNNIITRLIKFQIKSEYLYNSNKVKAMVKQRHLPTVLRHLRVLQSKAKIFNSNLVVVYINLSRVMNRFTQVQKHTRPDIRLIGMHFGFISLIAHHTTQTHMFIYHQTTVDPE